MTTDQTESHAYIHWECDIPILVVAADRTLESVVRRSQNEQAAWVVVVRAPIATDDVYYYAFRYAEIEQLRSSFPDSCSWPIEYAMDMHEWSSSTTTRGNRPFGPIQGQQGPAASRIINFDAAGRIQGIGERQFTREPADRYDSLDIAPMRGGGHSEPDLWLESEDDWDEASTTEVEVTLSAEAPAEIDRGANARIPFQIERSSEAMPLADFLNGRARTDLPIVVSLSVENDLIEIVRNRELKVEPPDFSEPRTGFFWVKGVRTGVTRLAVAFRQGGSDLGVIGLVVEVVESEAKASRARGETVAAPRDVADDERLLLTVQQIQEGGQAFYEYFLHSERLGLLHRLRSKSLLDLGDGFAATQLAFVERIYDRVTRELKSVGDLDYLQREARALGASLCRELFDPDVAKLLWPLREHIALVQIVSWEPYIPWELVRLQDPASEDIDGRFLCEYGLVRTLSDDMPPRGLRMEDWAYLGADFPMGSFPQVGTELDYFTSNSPESLRSHGIVPKAVDANPDAFYETLSEGDFDVLHLSCHAESPHKRIDRASLILGDETPPGASRPRLLEVDSIVVEAEAQLKRRRPLVFLNACETGRSGVVLTAYGGWPHVFLRKGAGAFVGTAWAVRDKPAAVFSTTFYNTILEGKTLAESATAARAAAKQLGDASWLAFKVYGHPKARRVRAF